MGAVDTRATNEGGARTRTNHRANPLIGVTSITTPIGRGGQVNAGCVTAPLAGIVQFNHVIRDVEMGELFRVFPILASLPPQSEWSGVESFQLPSYRPSSFQSSSLRNHLYPFPSRLPPLASFRLLSKFLVHVAKSSFLS
jgi:hypothetical protein